jgi:LPS sulfotransferase NodH
LFRAFVEERSILEKALALFPHQQSWTWVIYPDEATWKAFTHHINIDGDGPARSYYGQTDQEAHITYLRGWTLTHPNDDRALPMHVIAHELAYPYLKTRSLRAADDLSVEWVRKYTDETPRSALSVP